MTSWDDSLSLFLLLTTRWRWILGTTFNQRIHRRSGKGRYELRPSGFTLESSSSVLSSRSLMIYWTQMRLTGRPSKLTLPKYELHSCTWTTWIKAISMWMMSLEPKLLRMVAAGPSGSSLKSEYRRQLMRSLTTWGSDQRLGTSGTHTAWSSGSSSPCSLSCDVRTSST